MSLSAALWHQTAPVPAQQRSIIALQNQSNSPAICPFSCQSVLPDASLYGLGGSTADGVQAVCEFVLFVVQEPSGVSQTSDLHPSVALRLQLLCDVVHVQEDTCTAGTGGKGKSKFRRCN